MQYVSPALSQQKSTWLYNFGGFCLFLFAFLFLFCTCLVEPVDARPAADRGLTTRPGIWLAWLLPNLYFSGMHVVCWSLNDLPLLWCTPLIKFNATPWTREALFPHKFLLCECCPYWGRLVCVLAAGVGSQTQNWFVSKVSSLPAITLWQVQEMVNLVPCRTDAGSNLGMYDRNVECSM